VNKILKLFDFEYWERLHIIAVLPPTAMVCPSRKIQNSNFVPIIAVLGTTAMVSPFFFLILCAYHYGSSSNHGGIVTLNFKNVTRFFSMQYLLLTPVTSCREMSFFY